MLQDFQHLVTTAEQMADRMRLALVASGVASTKGAQSKTEMFLQVIRTAKRLLDELEASRCQQQADEKNLAALTGEAQTLRDQLRAERDKYFATTREYSSKVDQYSAKTLEMIETLKELRLAESDAGAELRKRRESCDAAKDALQQKSQELAAAKATVAEKELAISRLENDARSVSEAVDAAASLEKTLESVRTSKETALVRVRQLAGEASQRRREAQQRELDAAASVEQLQAENRKLTSRVAELERQAGRPNLFSLQSRKRSRPAGGEDAGDLDPGEATSWDVKVRSAMQWILMRRPIVQAGSSLTFDKAVAEMTLVAMDDDARTRVDALLTRAREGRWYCFGEFGKEGHRSPDSIIQPDGLCRRHGEKCLQIRRPTAAEGQFCVVLRTREGVI